MEMNSAAFLSTAGEFVEGVIASRPRVAVFDCDGTLWANNSGEDFFYWSMEPHRGLVNPNVAAWARQRYEDYRAGKVGEVQMCGEMTTMYAGTRLAALEAAASEFFNSMIVPNIFHEMLRLTRELAARGCEMWAVSSTNEWVIREGIREFGIPADHVLAGTAECVDNVVSEKLLRLPSGEGKAKAIAEVVLPLHNGRAVDAVFGNSIHDAAMLKMANRAYAVNPNPDLESLARDKGWTVYWPEAMRASAKQS
jgi:phosphoserine phosphatase